MAVDELEREQGKVLPAEDLTPYKGRWVALREGHVVASDFDAARLRDNPEVRDDDVLTPVPAQDEGVYIL